MDKPIWENMDEIEDDITVGNSKGSGGYKL